MLNPFLATPLDSRHKIINISGTVIQLNKFLIKIPQKSLINFRITPKLRAITFRIHINAIEIINTRYNPE